MWKPEFEGYWSDREKKIWEETNWKERDYKELPIEDDTFEADAYFYGIGTSETKKITFIHPIMDLYTLRSFLNL